MTSALANNEDLDDLVAVTEATSLLRNNPSRRANPSSNVAQPYHPQQQQPNTQSGRNDDDNEDVLGNDRDQQQELLEDRSKREPHAWYWPWPAEYWAVIPVIVLAGLGAGTVMTLTAPFLKDLICERGIPAHFPFNNRNGTYGQEHDEADFGNQVVATLTSLSTLWMTGQGGEQREGEQGRCDSPEYSAAIAKFSSINVSMAAILTTLTVRFWSSLSDRIGRRKSLMFWSLASTVSMAAPLCVYYFKNVSIYWIWVGGLMDGFVGSVLGLYALTHAYASDVTLPHERTVVFGRIVAGFYAGAGIGAALAGIVAERFGRIVAFWIVPSLQLMGLLYLFLIPESLTPKAMSLAKAKAVAKSVARSRRKGSNASSVADTLGGQDLGSTSTAAHVRNSESQSTLVNNGESYGSATTTTAASSAKTDDKSGFHQRLIKSLMPEQLPNRLGGQFSIMLLMTIVFFVLLGVIGATYQIGPYMLYMFRWSDIQLGNLGMIQGLSRLVSLTMLLPLVKRFSPKPTNPPSPMDPAKGIYFDLKVVAIGLFIEAVTMLLYAITPVGEGFYVGAALGSMGTLFFPALRGVLSQSVAAEMLGETLGTLATFESFAAAIGPSLFAWIYSQSLETAVPSMIFYVAGACCMITVVIASWVLLVHRREMRTGLLKQQERQKQNWGLLV